jgi:hypothetical protein
MKSSVLDKDNDYCHYVILLQKANFAITLYIAYYPTECDVVMQPWRFIVFCVVDF